MTLEAVKAGRARSESSPAGRGGHWRQDVQGLRAVAVLLVVAFHAGLPLPGGFVGVDVFFVISGFVIAGLLTREMERTSRISLAHFYKRRVKRLLPAMALMTMTTIIGASLLLSPLSPTQHSAGMAAASASGFVANIYFFVATGGYFQPAAHLNPFLHTWSLSVEEQFYLGFPALLIVGHWLERRVARARGLLLSGLLLLSFAACVAFTYDMLAGPVLDSITTNPDISRKFGFFSPVTRGWEFLAGALLAVRGPAFGGRRSEAELAAWVGLVLLALSGLLLSESQAFPGFHALMPVAGTALLLMAGPDTRLNRALAGPVLVWIGDRSYSWYLWHWPVIVFAALYWPSNSPLIVVAAVVSLIPAALSYRFVEFPIHRGVRFNAGQPFRVLLLTCLVLPIIGGLGLARLSDGGWGVSKIESLRAIVTPEHLDLVSGCALVEALGATGRPPCTWEVADAKGTVLLVGDSNAGHLTEPAIAAANKLGYNLEVATSGGCPLLIRSNYLTRECEAFVEGTLRAIRDRETPYAAVIVSNASIGYLGGPLAEGFVVDSPPGGGNPPTAVRGWAHDLAETVEAVATTSPAIVIGAVPQYGGLPECLVPNAFQGALNGCGWSPADSDPYRLRAETIAAESAAVVTLASAYLDTGSLLCRAAGCSAFLGDALVYRDGAHLSVTGSMLFEPMLRRGLATAVR